MITDIVTHVVITGEVQINTKPAKVSINPLTFTYPLNEVNGFSPFTDVSSNNTITSKLSGVPVFKYSFVTSASDTDSGVATKDYYTIDSTGKITYTGNGLPFDMAKTILYVKVADNDSPTVVKPAIATITLFGLTITFSGLAPQIGSSLSVSGLPSGASGMTYQWYTVDNGVASILSGSTGTTFTPAATETHKSIAVVVNYVSDGFKYSVSSLNSVTVLAADETPISFSYPVFAYKWSKTNVNNFGQADMDGYFAVYGQGTITNAPRIGGGGFSAQGGASVCYVTNISGHPSANTAADLTAASYSSSGYIDVQKTNIYEAFKFELKTILTDPTFKNIKYFAFVVHDLASVLRTVGSQLTYKLYDFENPSVILDSTAMQEPGNGYIFKTNMAYDGSAASAVVLGYFTRYESVWVYTPKMVYLPGSGDSDPNISGLHLDAPKVVVPPNHAPTGSITITSNNAANAAGCTLSLTNTVADADGLGTFSYQWKADGTAIANATAATYKTVASDNGKVMTCEMKYTDGIGNLETITSSNSITITQNHPATLTVTLTGTGKIGENLTATITNASDAEGLDSNAYQYMWSYSSNNQLRNGFNAPNSGSYYNSSTYPVQAPLVVGNAVYVRVWVTDALGVASGWAESNDIIVAAA
jgi:hypothetical protein